ncbi:MAG TPA: AAA family ATPase [Caulobacteraceae bacterium]
MAKRIHILGASGSGTTTLGRALAARLGVAHLDSDDFYWMPTQPPFETPRPAPERVAMLGAALDGAGDWVLSGSMVGWGDVFIPRIQLAVFLYLPPEIRLARLEARERERYGAAVEPGGARHAATQEFLAWACRYDDPDFDGRSLTMHRRWLAALPCPVVAIEGTPEVAESLGRVLGGYEP